MSQLPRLVVLTAIWVALWGQLTVANVFWGIVVAVALTVVFPTSGGHNGLRPLAALRFAATFTAMLVISTWQVVIEVLRPRLHLEQAIVAVPLRTDDPVVVTVVANAISLNPGTFTIDIGPEPEPGQGRLLYVHALRLGSVQDMVTSIHRLEDLAAAAFPPGTRRWTGPPGSATGDDS